MFFIECLFVVYLINSSYYCQQLHFHNEWKKKSTVVDSPRSRGQSELANMSCVRGGKLSYNQAKSLDQWGISYDCNLRPWLQNGSTFPQNTAPIDSQIQGSSWCSTAPRALTLLLLYYSIHCLQYLSAPFLYYRCNCKLFSVTRVRGLPAPRSPSGPCMSHITVL